MRVINSIPDSVKGDCECLQDSKSSCADLSCIFERGRGACEERVIVKRGGGLLGAQVMSKAQLPLLTSIIMVVQAFLSAPAGIRAKRSLKDRNQVLLLGYVAMIAADLSFALVPSMIGAHPCYYGPTSDILLWTLMHDMALGRTESPPPSLTQRRT